MVEPKELNQLIWGLLRGFRSSFELCEIIQEGVSFKRGIPKSFWNDENKGYNGILGFHDISKADMKKIHSEVVDKIISEMSNSKNMYSDNYFRLFHALTLLKVPKNDSRLPVESKNHMYNEAYYLWCLDDGSSRKYDILSKIAWHSAEATKESKANN